MPYQIELDRGCPRIVPVAPEGEEPSELAVAATKLAKPIKYVVGKIKDSGKLELVNSIDPCSCSLGILRDAWANGCNAAFGEES